MATRADAVVGSAFGDEGKGMITAVLAARCPGETLVVRYNGGAQAGHTVVTGEGRRHVFSHFGSGSLAGAATFLSRFFVANPILFHPERERLQRLGVAPAVLIDPRARVTTPYDMLVNTALERLRGTARHGSCGVGFGETVGRNEETPFGLTVGDLAGGDARRKVRAIRDQWLPRRLEQLGLQMTVQERDTLLSDALLGRFMDDVTGLLDCCRLAGEEVLRSVRYVVLEGAQGLLLDQDMGYFPHVTRSHTGLRNVGALIESAGITSLDVHYVLRPYLTRHGAGPLPGELPGPPWPGIVDETNIPNAWQGSLRFARINLDLLRRTVTRDLQHARLPAHVELRKHIAVTCLDQVDGGVRFVDEGRQETASPEGFVCRCLEATGALDGLAGRAPDGTACTAIPGPGARNKSRARARRPPQAVGGGRPPKWAVPG